MLQTSNGPACRHWEIWPMPGIFGGAEADLHGKAIRKSLHGEKYHDKSAWKARILRNSPRRGGPKTVTQ